MLYSFTDYYEPHRRPFLGLSLRLAVPNWCAAARLTAGPSWCAGAIPPTQILATVTGHTNRMMATCTRCTNVRTTRYPATASVLVVTGIAYATTNTSSASRNHLHKRPASDWHLFNFLGAILFAIYVLIGHRKYRNCGIARLL